MTIDTLKVVIEAETAGLKRELNNMTKELETVKNKTNSITNECSNSVKKMGNSMSNTFSKILKSISVAAIVAGIAKIGKQALQLASDLQEVQNVVDVSFGAMSKEVDEWASTAITRMGMSETSAKRLASTFATMGNSLGLAGETSGIMAMNLTQLAGDMASFYNTSTDNMETALKAVYTGETEALKKYGIVMTETNLKQYALSEGITKTYQELSESEKVMLRYKYVMNATNDAQGDFVRTSDSWANQLKVVKEQLNQFLTLLGQGLMQVLTPVLKVVGQVLTALTDMMQRLSNRLGWGKAKDDAVSAVNEIKDATVGEMTAIETATEAAKKAQKDLIGGFDELNKLSKNDPSETAAGGTATTLTIEPTFNANEAIEKTGLNAMEEKLDGLAQSFVNLFDGIIDLLKSLEPILMPILNLVISATAVVNNAVGGIVKNIAENKAFQSIITTLGNVIEKIGKIIEKIIPPLANLVSAILEPIFEIVDDILQLVEPILDIVLDLFSDALSPILDLISVLFPLILEPLRNVISMITAILQPALKAIKDILSPIWDMVGGICEMLIGVLTGDWEKAGQGLKKFFAGLVEGLIQPFVALFEFVVNAVINLINKLPGVNIKNVDWTSDIHKFFHPEETKSTMTERDKFNALKGYANGGVVTMPTLAMIGEDVRTTPEIVTPQALMQSTMDKSNQMVVTTLVGCCKQLITAIEDKDTSITIGDETIARSAQRGSTRYEKMTGKPLLA